MYKNTNSQKDRCFYNSSILGMLVLFVMLLNSDAIAQSTVRSETKRPKKGNLIFQYQNPISSGIDKHGLRDCQIVKDGDYWYMTGTAYPHWERQETDGNYNRGVPLYRSKDILNWEFVKYIVEAGGPDTWYHRRFWAPEIHKIGKKYYATFNCNNPNLGYLGQHTGYAVADHIEGPYSIVTKEKPLSGGNDLTFFADTDGKVWAFWNAGRTFGIGYAQIDLSTGTFLTQPTTAIQSGRVDYAYDQNGNLLKVSDRNGRLVPKVARYRDWDAIGIEGACVIKEKDTYYLFYSSWSRGYEIGYATAKSITGPWEKNEGNPFYGAQNKTTCKENGFEWQGNPENPFRGVGHNQIFKGPDGRYWLSCHGVAKERPPLLVIDPIWFDDNGNVQSNGPTYTLQSIY
ncbi:glycoside hydrolase family 43 protein [Parapedobacter soli]|uniref:glycoside hydrolase family 43 protein n=1 Tax=Parapedobacter soli TaxID=416955 RepID=UPI0021C5E334|nr:family 43 glycosylhydrolase [Parapedobacter soli]